MSILVETELLTLEKFVKFDDAKADLKTKRKKNLNRCFCKTKSMDAYRKGRK